MESLVYLPDHPSFVPGIQSLIRTTLATTSHISKGLCVVFVVFFFLAQSPAILSYIAVTPGEVIARPHVFLFSLVTGGLVETWFLDVLLDCLGVVIAGQLFETLWGSIELKKFMLVSSVGSLLLTCICYIILYALTFDTDYLFGHVCGFVGVLSAFTVAYKQLYPQKSLRGAGYVFESRLLPLALCLSVSLLYVLGLMAKDHIVLSLNGVIVGWIYLRFYQNRNGMRGDRSDSFAFADFFPARLQPAVSSISGRIFKLAVMLHLCKKDPPQYDLSAPSAITLTVHGAPSDEDRRRLLAVRDLDLRLGHQQTSSSSSSPPQGSRPPPMHVPSGGRSSSAHSLPSLSGGLSLPPQLGQTAVPAHPPSTTSSSA